MNHIPEELLVYRRQLRDAVDRDLRMRRRTRIAVPTVGVLAAGTAAVVLGVMLTAASAQNAYGSAKKALALTAAASSGTITGTVTHDGSSYTLDTTRWNGDSIAVTPGDRSELGPNQALDLVDGTAYVEQQDGRWLQYASESAVGPKVGPQFELAHNNVAGHHRWPDPLARDRAHPDLRSGRHDPLHRHDSEPRHGYRRRTHRQLDPAHDHRPPDRQQRPGRLPRRSSTADDRRP